MRAQSFAALWTATLILGCPADSPTTGALLAEPARAVEPADNAVAVAWNEIAYQTANAHDQFLSFVGARTLAMTHIAMHDALNAIVPKYEPYAFKATAAAANATAAATQAAYAVLIAVYPKQQATLDAARAQWLAKVPNGSQKDRGIATGAQAAAAILGLRQGDGHDAMGDYRPGGKPGDYQFTPGFNFSLAPDFRLAKPFALRSSDQFRASAPPALNSAEYEVKRFGVTKSTVRTADQTSYAHWWAEFAEHSWNRIGRLTAVERQLDLWRTARMFALVNMDIFDVYLAIWDSKYHYNTWRPITAIRSAAQDGNSQTQPDPAWEPEMVTLPFPDYPSGHSAVCSEVITHVYGTSRVTFRMQSLTALPGSETRAFDDLRRAANECADSRVMNGYHFRFATEEGKALGRRVAEHLVATQLRALTQ
jgi:hypothetical protein